jgi:hypothetical protein
MIKRLAAAAPLAPTARAEPPMTARLGPGLSRRSSTFTFPAVGTLAVPYALVNGSGETRSGRFTLRAEAPR